MTLNELGERAFNNAKAKGFHEFTPQFGAPSVHARHILSWLMLICTEVAEAAEEVRKGNDKKKLESEFADIIIRTVDAGYALGLDLDEAVLWKMTYNETRPVKHGGKLA